MKFQKLVVLFLLLSFFLIVGCSKREESESEDLRKVLRKGATKKLVITPLDEEQAAYSGESSTAAETGNYDKTEKIEKQEKIFTELDKKVVTGPIVEENDNQAAYTDESDTVAETEKYDEIKVVEKEEKGIYIAKGDESLLKISAREDVYGDPLKWVLLYRFNREMFNKIDLDNTLPDKIIPAETRLKVVDPGEAESTFGTDSKTHWVVNVLSFREGENIVPYVVRLVDNGFAAYIIKANVKGQDYIRLRVGFFSEKTEAVNEGKQIMTLLNTSDFWITKADKAEFEGFGGYR